MQPAPSTPIALLPIPAVAQLSENPRPGFTSKNAAWNPGPNVPNSTAVIGMRAGLALEGVRARCSGEQYDSDLGLYYLRARYYNPQTGRFLSRDPEDGEIKIPASLHKYLYTDGDPVDRIDPRGRDAFEFIELVNQVGEETIGATTDEVIEDSVICRAFTEVEKALTGFEFREAQCELGTL